MQINSKVEFYRLWNAGALGYKLRTWETLEDFLRDTNKPPIIGFRQVGAAGGGRLDIVPLPHGMAESEARRVADDWRSRGMRFVICEAAPDEHGTLQGEICRTVRGWEGTMGLSRGMRMREAIAAGRLVPRSPAVTRFLVRHYMSAASLDDLDAILELYPDAVVEFTCYELTFERGRNTIFWEVRNY